MIWPRLILAFAILIAFGPLHSETLYKSYNNPLYPEYQRLGAIYGVDMSFTRNVTSLRPYDPRLSQDATTLPIFCEPAHSLDVILVGDSTLSWGVIPKVVEQVSHKKVGMFAFRAFYLNRRTMNVTRRVVQHFLKPNGIAIFGFTIWTQQQAPDTFQRNELVYLESMSDPDFERFTKIRLSLCQNESAYVDPSAFPSISLNDFQFLRWDAQTFTLIGPFQGISIPSNSPPSDLVGVSEIQKINARAMAAIPGRKAFLITLHENDYWYVTQRSWYRDLFSKDFELIDLGVLHPKGQGITLDGISHPVLTGGFFKSVLIGSWLKEHPDGPAR